MNDATNNSFSSDSLNDVPSSAESGDSLQSQETIKSNSNTKSATSPQAKETSVKPLDCHNIDWQQLAHKLREHNRKLLKKVFNLEQNLIDLTNQVQQHQEIARQEELTITEQSEKLNHSQEEIADLSKQIDKQSQEIKSQEVLIKNLSLQLKAAQQQTAKLERECAVVQENYNQKNYELSSLTEQKEELQSRLYRQQQQTLHYKAALEKYSAKEEPLEKLPAIKILSRLKAQPIQPWSDGDEDLGINNVLSTLANDENNNHLVQSSVEPPRQHRHTKSPAPEISDVPTDKQPKSISAVKLPKFQKANQ